ncbi:MAG TPA: N-acetylmuramic acid 6-phosphate etherase [Negativicutes bacterium]|nr:N-acetylmuramic acid 6-phosphate etherase [Negativicutes bacterium]
MNTDRLETERRNPDTNNLDMLPTHELVAAIQREDEKVAAAVRKALPEISAAVELIVTALRGEGRLFYIGAGTSGRLGVLDAAECPPTFNTPPDLVQALIAGGEGAMFRSIEGAEDDPNLAEQNLRDRKLSANDVVVGLAASGRTPYVLGGLRYAAGLGCPTIALVCVSDSEFARVARITIAIPVGPEVIAGSTRMKAGTAQKMALNMISTATMVKLGKTYGNLMVDVKASNAKLTARVHRIVRDATGVGAQEAATALTLAAGSAKVAIVMLLTGVSPEISLRCIEKAHGSVRHALIIAARKSEAK